VQCLASRSQISFPFKIWRLEDARKKVGTEPEETGEDETPTEGDLGVETTQDICSGSKVTWSTEA
jgi:hypothetical protein